MDPMTPGDRGDFVDHERDLRGWRISFCAAHAYEGIPPCPWPDCPNSSGKDVYLTIHVGKVDPITAEVSVMEERIFVRQHGPVRKSWVWREVVYAEQEQ